VKDILGKIAHNFANLENSNQISKLVNEALEEQIPVFEILEKGLRKGLEEVGRKFEAKQYFLAELLYAASIMEEVMTILRPRLKSETIKKEGLIVLGTVRGDIHDIGKNIFKMLAEAAGFEIHDLGVDVEPEKFIEMVKEKKPNVLGLSALLTTTIPEMKIVIEELKKAGLRNKVKVLLGGNAVTEEFRKEIGADAAVDDAVKGVELCKEWMSE